MNFIVEIHFLLFESRSITVKIREKLIFEDISFTLSLSLFFFNSFFFFFFSLLTDYVTHFVHARDLSESRSLI